MHTAASPVKAVRSLLRADQHSGYANVDIERAARLGSALWIIAAICVAALLPIAPPTDPIDASLGWLIAGALVAGCVLAAVRLLAKSAQIKPARALRHELRRDRGHRGPRVASGWARHAVPPALPAVGRLHELRPPAEAGARLSRRACAGHGREPLLRRPVWGRGGRPGAAVHAVARSRRRRAGVDGGHACATRNAPAGRRPGARDGGRRLPHRPRKPASSHGRPRPAAPLGLDGRARAGAVRPRRVQGLQRQLRTCGRRHSAYAPRTPAGRGDRRPRFRVPDGRRRILCPGP